MTTKPSWPRSARAWTGFRSRSSSPPTARACSRCRPCWSGWSGGWSCCRAARATCPSASARCGRRSSGRGRCSTTSTARCSRSSACSRAARRCTRCTPSATRAHRPRCCWRRSWTARRSWSSTPATTRNRGSRCSTPCASSPPRRPVTSPDSSSATRRTSSTYAERAATEAARADRRAWLARLTRERGNLRVAFERSLRAGQAEDALRIAIAFARTLPWDAHAQEVRGWLAQALEDFDPRPSVRRAAALYWDGQLALAQGAVRRGRDAARAGAHRRAGPRRRRARGPRAGRARPPCGADRLARRGQAVRHRRGARPRAARSGAARRHGARARGRV